MEPEKPMNKQKAKDLAVWKSFIERKQGKAYKVAGDKDSGYYLVPVIQSSNSSLSYANMDYEHIKDMRTDTEPLSHWEQIAGMISTTDGEVLRFILKHQVPLDKFIRYELASRGFDENHLWVGFDEAERIWLK